MCTCISNRKGLDFFVSYALSGNRLNAAQVMGFLKYKFLDSSKLIEIAGHIIKFL